MGKVIPSSFSQRAFFTARSPVPEPPLRGDRWVFVGSASDRSLRMHGENLFGRNEWALYGCDQAIMSPGLHSLLLRHPPQVGPRLYLGPMPLLCLHYDPKFDCLLRGNLFRLRLFCTSSDSLLECRQVACWMGRGSPVIDPDITLLRWMRLGSRHPQVGCGCLVGGYHDHHEDGAVAEVLIFGGESTSTTRPFAAIQ
ncbi:uncharacterized protein ARMOST_21215 [Armillaria ostoyae]|uniref:Uncharacterized protein n=1 Tax=Armillaria ostoyae TaxID=47428 RepID=A0A284S9H0_ARMOS|nr:uncharacterized protein ARMOST_21215 [Armillaria ostoyae]